MFAEIDLGDRSRLNTVDVTRDGGGLMELPGPRTRPVRPHLELSDGRDGVVGRVVRGDGRALPLAIVLSDGSATTVRLESEPLALAPRADGGVWALSPGGLIGYSADGAMSTHVDVSGQALVAAGSSVWVVSQGAAVFVDGEGSSLSRPIEWRANDRLATSDQALCGISKSDPPHLTCIDPDGTERRYAVPALEPLEQLLYVGGDGELVTLSGSTVRRHRSDDAPTQTIIQAAGIDEDGAPFVGGSDDEGVHSLTVGQTVSQLPGAPDAPELGVMPVVARRGATSLAYAQDRAVWYDTDGQIASSFSVDDDRYRDDVFPLAWHLAPVRGIAAISAEEVLVSTSGPTGLVVLGVTLPR